MRGKVDSLPWIEAIIVKKDIVEVSKSEYNRLVQHYQKQHETNLSMTITR